MVRHSEDKQKNGHAQVSGSKKGRDDDEDGADLEAISRACDGLARVIIPIIRGLHDGPGLLGNLE